ncbi:MAG: Hsp20/alpha crystallin family protein [Burkholderiales bacterium]|nr:Hsp20/alpha crystallin family protein [Burkholderiales bacterium]
MANLTRFNSPFDDTFDDLLRGFFVRPVAYDGQPAAQFKMDVREEENAYVVHADIPGVKKEDIRVSIDGNQVSIGAEVKRATEEKNGGRVLKVERYTGKVSRSFTLASEVDAGAANARYADGVLELTLPKKAASSAKQLTIN